MVEQDRQQEEAGQDRPAERDDAPALMPENVADRVNVQRDYLPAFILAAANSSPSRSSSQGRAPQPAIFLVDKPTTIWFARS